MHSVPTLADGPADTAIATERTRALAAAIATLPSVYREAVVLVDVQGFANDEAAGIAGVEVMAFKSRLHRGRMALRVVLEGRLSAGLR